MTGFLAGYGQLARARSARSLSDHLLEAFLNSPEPTGPKILSAEDSKQPSAELGFAWPAAGELTSHFGPRWGRHHQGIDIANSIGTPINAVADGTVVYAGWSDGGYGNLIEIVHRNGMHTLYAHNSKLLVKTGDSIKRSQIIALMGESGRSTGPHLHFEIRSTGDQAVNPLAYLDRPS